MVALLILACATQESTLSKRGSDLPAVQPEAEEPEAAAEPRVSSWPVPGDPAEPEVLEPEERVFALSRASLDLRGVRPSLMEIESVEADPAAYESIVESYLYDARFGSRVRSLFSTIYLTSQDYYYISASEFGISDSVGFNAAVGQEPLRILSTIAEEDLPYTLISTADWTMANELLGQAFPVDYPADQSGWQKVSYTDGRPAAGILSTNGIWWRYLSTDSNANRGRANAVSRILTCHDYLSRPIEFDRNVNLLDSDALADALETNPGCVNCHVSLDPLASYFYGFYQYMYDSRLEMTGYHAEREGMWEESTGAEPAYMGEPGYTLFDLGQQIADDPRLAECITEQVHELLLARPSELEDMDRLTRWRQSFLEEGMVLRSLLRSALAEPEYQTGRDALGEKHPKMMSPEQFASAVEDITGFRFTSSGYDLMTSDAYGVRTLAGGVDGVYATRPAEAPTATSVLVVERVAQAAAWYAVERDAADRDAALLFTGVDFTERPDSEREAMAAQIQALHLRIFGKRVALDGPEVEANLELWTDLLAVDGDPKAAWAGLLSVMLRDADFLFY